MGSRTMVGAAASWGNRTGSTKAAAISGPTSGSCSADKLAPIPCENCQAIMAAVA